MAAVKGINYPDVDNVALFSVQCEAVGSLTAISHKRKARKSEVFSETLSTSTTRPVQSRARPREVDSRDWCT